jgi:hypothetical protein
MRTERRAFLFFLVLLLGGFAFGWLVLPGLLATFGRYSFAQLGLLVPCLPLVYLLVITTHEAGHVVAGWTQGFRLHVLGIGPFLWRIEGGKPRFAWNRRIDPAGGLTIMLPPDEIDLATRFSRFVAGGPLASLLLTAGGLGGALAAPAGSFPELIAGLAGAGSALACLLTMVPFRSGGFSSDAKHFLALRQRSPAAEATLTLLRAYAHLQTDRPLRELPIAAIERARTADGVWEGQPASLAYFAYLHHLEAGRMTEAREALDVLLGGVETLPAGMGEALHLEAVLFHAFVTRDRAQAEAAWERFQTTPLVEVFELALAEAGLARLRAEPLDLGNLEALLASRSPHLLERAKRSLYRRWLDDLARDEACAQGPAQG